MQKVLSPGVYTQQRTSVPDLKYIHTFYIKIYLQLSLTTKIATIAVVNGLFFSTLMLVDGQQDGNLLGRGSATAIPRILFLGTASLTRIKSAKNRPDNQRPSVFACVMIYLLSISGK